MLAAYQPLQLAESTARYWLMRPLDRDRRRHGLAALYTDEQTVPSISQTAQPGNQTGVKGAATALISGVARRGMTFVCVGARSAAVR